MKRLMVCTICCFVALAAHAQQKKNSTQRMDAQVAMQVQKAQQKNQVSISGDKRVVSVRLEVQEQINDTETFHRYWECPAVIFNKAGALAFDGECWNAIEEASKKDLGPSVLFFVDLGKLGEYHMGEEAGRPFYFESSYAVDGPGSYQAHSVDEAFKRSADQSYIIYKLSLFNDPQNEGNVENSEVKQAISQYYQQNNLREVKAETLSGYFQQKHPRTHKSITRFP